MAIKLTTDQIVRGCRILAAASIWAFCVWCVMAISVPILSAAGCATVDNRDAEFALLNSQLTQLKAQIAGKIDESASPTTTAGDDATITNISFGSTGVMVVLLGLLGWRHRTATGALDRVIDCIEERHLDAKTCGNFSEAEELKRLKEHIWRSGTRDPDQQDFRSDRHERFLWSRLKKMAK